MSDTKKIVQADLDEIVEAVMPLYHRYDGENKCTLEKTSHELGDDEPMECSCDYTHRLRTALERFVVEETARLKQCEAIVRELAQMSILDGDSEFVMLKYKARQWVRENDDRHTPGDDGGSNTNKP